MKKRLLMFAVLPLTMMACSGGGEEKSEETTPREVEASEADMETVEETKTTKAEVDRVNQDVDSILNTLEQ